MASLLRKTWAACRAPANGIAFALRRRAPALWAPPPRLQREPKERLFGDLDAAARREAEALERDLRQRYRLQRLRDACSRREYRDIVDLCCALDRLGATPAAAAALAASLGGDGERPLRLVDVGAQTWSYVGALERWVRTRRVDDDAPIEITGVEVDGRMRGRDGATCEAHGRAQARRAVDAAAQASGESSPLLCRYETLDFRRWSGPPQDVVTMLYPFLSRYPLLDWGLPLGLFDPAGLVCQAAAALRPGGLLISMHQNDDELRRMLAVVEAAAPGLQLVATQPHRTKLVSYWPRTQGRQVGLFRAGADRGNAAARDAAT